MNERLWYREESRKKCKTFLNLNACESFIYCTRIDTIDTGFLWDDMGSRNYTVSIQICKPLVWCGPYHFLAPFWWAQPAIQELKVMDLQIPHPSTLKHGLNRWWLQIPLGIRLGSQILAAFWGSTFFRLDPNKGQGAAKTHAAHTLPRCRQRQWCKRRLRSRYLMGY